MRTFGKSMLALGVAVILTAPASVKAQGGRGQGGMMGGGALGALMTPEGQKELSLTEDQLAKIRDVAQSIRTTRLEKFQALQDVAEEDRPAKMREIAREMSATTEKELKEILKPEQMKRYQEIDLQAQGINAFNQEEVAKRLKLTDDQKKKIADIQEDTQSQMREIFQNAGGDRQAAGQKMRELMTSSREKVTALLTEDQKATWKEMTGKPFERPTEGFGGRGRRNRNNDN
jgi:Spy/CpxP family protein refolding chaperone